MLRVPEYNINLSLGGSTLIFLYIHRRGAFFALEGPRKYHAWSCQNVYDALTFLLDKVFF